MSKRKIHFWTRLHGRLVELTLGNNAVTLDDVLHLGPQTLQEPHVRNRKLENYCNDFIANWKADQESARLTLRWPLKFKKKEVTCSDCGLPVMPADGGM